MKVEWSTKSLSMMKDYVEIIKLDKTKAAIKWSEEVFEKGESLSEFPMIGKVVPEFGISFIREIRHAQHRIIYRLSSDLVEIVMVIHSKQLLPGDI